MPSSPAQTRTSFRRSLNLSSCLCFGLSLFAGMSAQAQLPEPPTVRIGVLSLFHPHTLLLSSDHPITLLLDGAPHILDPHQQATIRSTPNGLIVDEIEAHTLALQPETFTLTVPNKLTRRYRGALTVTTHNNTLIPVITIDTELAVASIVASEAPPGAPLEALKAQAIASRSFLLANPHPHQLYDACDTTHCQFLRSPPAANSPAAVATQATHNQVLTWQASPEDTPHLVAAMYSRSCGGQTRPLALADPTKYPFYSVRCDFCRRHPEPQTPSHHVGLCQLGAADLARHGQTFAQILAHFYPNTTLAKLP